MNIAIAPRKVLNKSLTFIFFLLIANLIVVFSQAYFVFDDVHGLTRLFSFSAEKNIPTLFSSLALILSAALLLVIATTHKKLKASYLPWLGLTFVFLFLAIDETASIHEKLTLPVRESLNTSGFLYFAWVIPYGIALAILWALYSKFLINLPRRTMILFFISGLIYVSGAMGLEMIGGLRADLHGSDDLVYLLIVTCEEFLEMLGIVIFIYALLLYMAEHLKGLRIVVGHASFQDDPNLRPPHSISIEPTEKAYAQKRSGLRDR